MDEPLNRLASYDTSLRDYQPMAPENDNVSNKLPMGCLIASAILLVLIVGGYFLFQRVRHNSAIETTKVWARLNDFPTSASNLTVETAGSMFTREFTIQFDAPLADIETWISESPGTKDVTPIIHKSTRKYTIEPGDGAQHAELELDEQRGHVKINTFWS